MLPPHVKLFSMSSAGAARPTRVQIFSARAGFGGLMEGERRGLASEYAILDSDPLL